MKKTTLVSVVLCSDNSLMKLSARRVNADTGYSLLQEPHEIQCVLTQPFAPKAGIRVSIL